MKEELNKLVTPLNVQIWRAYREKEKPILEFGEILDKNFTENVLVVRALGPEIMTGEDLADLLDELGAGDENFAFSEVDKVEIESICEELGVKSAGKWICFEKVKTKNKIKELPLTLYFHSAFGATN